MGYVSYECFILAVNTRYESSRVSLSNPRSLSVDSANTCLRICTGQVITFAHVIALLFDYVSIVQPVYSL